MNTRWLPATAGDPISATRMRSWPSSSDMNWICWGDPSAWLASPGPISKTFAPVGLVMVIEPPPSIVRPPLPTLALYNDLLVSAASCLRSSAICASAGSRPSPGTRPGLATTFGLPSGHRRLQEVHEFADLLALGETEDALVVGAVGQPAVIDDVVGAENSRIVRAKRVVHVVLADGGRPSRDGASVQALRAVGECLQFHHVDFAGVTVVGDFQCRPPGGRERGIRRRGPQGGVFDAVALFVGLG